MADKNFFKDNFVLIVGLALPVVLMVGFILVSAIPATLGDPPKYDLIFSSPEYSTAGKPVTVSLIVRDGTLKAQFTKVTNTTYPSTQWIKLYQYDAKTQKVRELALGIPADVDDIKTMREDTVDATKDLKLDTNTTSPDGYELSNTNYHHSGLVGDIFGGFGSGGGEMALRKGAATVRLSTGDNTYPFYYGSANFIGWVKQ